MRAPGWALLLSAALSGPAAAGDIGCWHPGGAMMDLLVDRTSGPIHIDRAVVTIRDEVWTTSNEMEPSGKLVAVGQVFEDDRQLLVDLVDDDEKTAVLARLRVLYAHENDMRAGGGVLQVAGRGAWAVDCNEPE